MSFNIRLRPNRVNANGFVDSRLKVTVDGWWSKWTKVFYSLEEGGVMGLSLQILQNIKVYFLHKNTLKNVSLYGPLPGLYSDADCIATVTKTCVAI